jgi:cellobiose dehydrogenase (acceptor)
MGSSEFVGEIVASNNALWAAYDLGTSMADNLLLLVWPNANKLVYSVRMAE